MADTELLTTAQVQSLLQIGRTKLWELVRRGAFPAYRIGAARNGPLRFRRDEVLSWLDRTRVGRPARPRPESAADLARE